MGRLLGHPEPTARLVGPPESVEVTRDLDDTLVSTYASVALASTLYESGEPARAIEILLTSAGGEELPRIASGWRANYFELLTHSLVARADSWCGGRLVSALEGGYDPDRLAQAALRHLTALAT